MTIADDAILFITGASSGIGAATARLLAAPGRTIHLQGRDEQRLAAVVEDVTAAGGTAVPHRLELEDASAVDVAAIELASSIPSLDLLVHSAGMVALSPVESSDVAELDRQYAVNLRAPFALTTALTPALVAARGQVVFVNSGAGQRSSPGWSQYAATKFGLRALADAFRGEVADRGVRVTTVFPGRTATPMQQEVHRFEGREYHADSFMGPEQVASTIVHAIEMPRSATVPEISIR
ncbi:MAG: SDR family oxidoreductase [Phycisphaerales bacterium]|nr:SDR family oxidoreductase [Phycisphaerales bacterium]